MKRGSTTALILTIVLVCGFAIAYVRRVPSGSIRATVVDTPSSINNELGASYTFKTKGGTIYRVAAVNEAAAMTADRHCIDIPVLHPGQHVTFKLPSADLADYGGNMTLQTCYDGAANDKYFFKID